MSYILEALKKSQQERELGKVPTLDTAGMFEEDTAEPPHNPWPMVATGLAGAAMLIALYAALRGPAPAASLSAERVGRFATESAATIPLPPEPAPLRLQDMDNLSVANRPLIPAPVAAPPAYPAEPFGGQAAEPLVEPPPPRRPTPPKFTEPVGSVDFPGDVPLIHPDLSKESDLAAELELQRQLDAELDPVSYEGEGMSDTPTAVPRDLIADIETFKEEVLKDRSGAPEKKVRTPEPIDKDPTKLRLTRAQEADLPAYLMTVHVYDTDKSRAFVLISGRKYREGDETRQGMKVERILADGAVLSYRGNPFFVHR